MKRWLLFAVLLAALASPAQESSPAPVAPPTPVPVGASVKFDFEWIQGVPWQKYSIEMQADRKARFEGTPAPDGTRDTDVYRQDFTMSAANQQKIFDLSKTLNYFRGDLDSHLKHIAQTGKKTLVYSSPEAKGSATFNWSQNADVQELTRIFMGIAMTIDYGRKLAFQYRFDKLGISKRLEELTQLQADHQAEEIQIIAPILHKIADDPDMMNISRQSAAKLLRSTKTVSPALPSPAFQ